MRSHALAARLALVTAVALASGAALAKQTHHCKLADGTMDMKQTKKQCLAAKGTWAKDTATAMPAAGAMPMPSTAKAAK